MENVSEPALNHGFASRAVLGESSELFDDATLLELGAVRISHGYLDVWEASLPWEQPSWPDAALHGSGEAIHTGHLEVASSPTDDPIVHGEEAAVWASIGRRALLDRMAED